MQNELEEGVETTYRQGRDDEVCVNERKKESKMNNIIPPTHE